jgi:pentatricopeptide repeat protein
MDNLRRCLETVQQDALSKCGHLDHMIVGHVKCGQGQKALELFEWMQQEDAQPDSATFVVVLNARASMVALQEGRCVHEQSI